MFLLLLCNDKDVLGPWVNRRITNVFTSGVIAVLITLSVVLTASVVFPGITAGQIVAICATCAAVSILGGLVMLVRRPADPHRRHRGDERGRGQRGRPQHLADAAAERADGAGDRRGRQLGLTALWAYLLIALAMVIVKVVLIALH